MRCAMHSNLEALHAAAAAKSTQCIGEIQEDQPALRSRKITGLDLCLITSPVRGMRSDVAVTSRGLTEQRTGRTASNRDTIRRLERSSRLANRLPPFVVSGPSGVLSSFLTPPDRLRLDTRSVWTSAPSTASPISVLPSASRLPNSDRVEVVSLCPIAPPSPLDLLDASVP